MSNKRTDSNGYTIVFAIVMVVVVGFLLAFFANFTQELRDKNEKVKKKIDVLNSIGIQSTRANADTLFDTYIKEQYVINGTKANADQTAYLIDLKKEQDKLKNGKIPNLPLFIADVKGEQVYIIPVRGNGLWDAIWGYVALNKDLKSIYGVYFDHRGETPGLGANITEAYFTDDFKGEMLYDKDGNFKSVEISKTNGDPNNNDKLDNQVDALSGATITGNGVGAMLKKGMKLYLPYFKTLK